jgi:dCTP deaminase
MAFWSADTWRALEPKPVAPFNESRLESANYLLSIGEEIYVSEDESKGQIRRLNEGDGFAIDPGQFAFLLTEEKVTMPPKSIGFISIRASIKFLGLVNVSGFHIDPGFSGKLIFSVFNAGPTRIHLRRGDPIFMLWLADFDGISEGKNGYEHIPSDMITKISGNFTTAYQVQKQVNGMKQEIAALNAFKLHAVVVLALAGALLIPVFKTTLAKLIQEPPFISHPGINILPPKPPAKSSPPATPANRR